MTSSILQTATRLLMPLLLLFAVFLLLRGHNQPGGGFVGGLVVASSFVLYSIAFGVDAAGARCSSGPHASRRRAARRVDERASGRRHRAAVHDRAMGRGARRADCCRCRNTAGVRRRRVPRGDWRGVDHCVHVGGSQPQRGLTWNFCSRFSRVCSMRTGLYLMLRRRLAQLIIGLGLLSNGSNILILAAAGVTRAKPPLIEQSSLASGSVRRSRSPVADPHSDCHRLRCARVCARAGSPRASIRRFRRHRHDRTGPAVMLLALPILLPLGTAIALHLLPQRRRLLRVVAFAGALLILGVAAAIFVRVQCRQASRCCKSAHGRRRSASRWLPICSAR